MQKITSVSLGVALCFVLACGGSNTSAAAPVAARGPGALQALTSLSQPPTKR